MITALALTPAIASPVAAVSVTPAGGAWEAAFRRYKAADAVHAAADEHWAALAQECRAKVPPKPKCMQWHFGWEKMPIEEIMAGLEASTYGPAEKKAAWIERDITAVIEWRAARDRIMAPAEAAWTEAERLRSISNSALQAVEDTPATTHGELVRKLEFAVLDDDMAMVERCLTDAKALLKKGAN